MPRGPARPVSSWRACAGKGGNSTRPLELIERALAANWHNHRARHLKIAFLRKLGRRDEAKAECELSLRHDRMNYGAAFERMYLHSDLGFRELLRDNAQTYIEVALDYAHAGLWSEASGVLKEAPATDPMVLYYLGWCEQVFDGGKRIKPWAVEIFEEAARMSPDYCFPNRIECIAALETAMRLNPDDARAPYYLGNFWYAHRQYDDAILCWERSLRLDGSNPTAHRNLGLALLNKRGDAERALCHYERAFALDQTDARILFELDQLYIKIGKSPAERLTFLQQHQTCVDQRDDLTIQLATLHNLLGRPQAALDTIMGRVFHPWEGGEGKVTGQYVTSLIQLAREHIRLGDYDCAIDCLSRAREYPRNLGEGKLLTAPENDIHYHLGLAHELRGDSAAARAHFTAAAQGEFEPASPRYYNDQPPERILYQGLAQEKLGMSDQARSTFERLIEYGEAHLHDEVTMDYFAVSLPNFLVFEDDLTQRNHIHCLYLIALGRLGLGERASAVSYFDEILARDPNHLGASLCRQVGAAQVAAKVGN